MGVLDLLIALWVAVGAGRGGRHGLPVELPRLIGVGVFAMTGFGLFTWTNRALTEVSRATGMTANGAGFFSLLLASWFLARHFRQRIRDWASRRWGKSPARGSAIGAVRAFLVACVLLLVLAHWPLKFLTKGLVESSLLGRTLTRHVLPVYAQTHNGPL